MEITIHEEKICHFTFHGKKKGRSRVTKIPFTTLNYGSPKSILYAYYGDKEIIKSARLKQMVHMKCTEWSLYLFKFIFCFQVTLYTWACIFSLKPYSDAPIFHHFIAYRRNGSENSQTNGFDSSAVG